MLAIAIEELPKLVHLAHRSRNNVLVVGDPGVGKSQVVESMKSDTCRTFAMTGSSTIEEYVNGIPQVGVWGLAGDTCLQYVPPKWLVEITQYGEKHPDHTQVLFLDEFNTADPQVLKTFLTILTERRIPTCDISLPDNVVIVAAMNPQDQNEGEPLIRPLVSRFLTVQVRSSIDQYRKFITGKENTLTHCDFKMLDKAAELTVPEKDTMVRSVSASDWGKFEDGEYHEINPRSFDNYFRALSWCEDKAVAAPLLSQAFLGIKLSMPVISSKKPTPTTADGSELLSKEQLAELSKDDLLDYGAIIYRGYTDENDSRVARLLFQAELLRRGIEIDSQKLIERGSGNGK